MRKKTDEEFRQSLFEKWGDKVTPLTKYDGNKNKVHFRCNVCGNEFDARPNDILVGWTRWCPFCSEKIRRDNSQKTNEQYLEDLKKVHGDKYTPLEEYGSNRNVKILHRCNTCGYEWKISPHSLLGGEGCPECKKKTIGDLKRKTQEQYEKELQEVWKGRIILIDEYISTDTKVLHKCTKCGKEWLVTPHNLLAGSGCPRCNYSKGETKIELFLEEQHINYEAQKRFDSCRRIKPLPFDFYLPDYNICIEFQGNQHNKPVKKFGGKKGFEERKINDKIKKDWCAKPENPNLLEIKKLKDVERKILEAIKKPS